MEKCWKIVGKIEKRKYNGNCCKIREKKKTNKQSLNTIKAPRPNREDQLSKIHGMTTCVLSLCERVRRKPEV